MARPVALSSSCSALLLLLAAGLALPGTCGAARVAEPDQRTDSNKLEHDKNQPESGPASEPGELLVKVMNDSRDVDGETRARLLGLAGAEPDGRELAPAGARRLPARRRRIVYEDTIFTTKALDEVSNQMTKSFDYESRSDPSIHWVIFHNATALLVVRSANKYYYWTSAQSVSSAVIFCMIVVGNLSILHRLKSCRRRRSNVNYFIVQLAIADLLVGLFCVTLDFWFRIQKAFVWGLFACRASKYISDLFIYSSTNLLVALSVDRWEAVVKPLAFTRNRSRGYHLVAASWTLATVSALPVAFFSNIRQIDGLPQCWIDLNNDGWRLYMIYLTSLLLVLPTLIIAVCYTHIVYTIWKKGRLVAGQQQRRARNANAAYSSSPDSLRQDLTSSSRLTSRLSAGGSDSEQPRETLLARLLCCGRKCEPGEPSAPVVSTYTTSVFTRRTSSDISTLGYRRSVGGFRRCQTIGAPTGSSQPRIIQWSVDNDDEPGTRPRELAARKSEPNIRADRNTGAPLAADTFSIATSSSASSSSSLGATNPTEATRVMSSLVAADGQAGQGLALSACDRPVSDLNLQPPNSTAPRPSSGGQQASEVADKQANRSRQHGSQASPAVDAKGDQDKPSSSGDDERRPSPAATLRVGEGDTLVRHSMSSLKSYTGMTISKTGSLRGNRQDACNPATAVQMGPRAISENCDRRKRRRTRRKSSSDRQLGRPHEASSPELPPVELGRDSRGGGGFIAQQHGSGVIPKARVKTIKMTLVIVVAYILCWSPFLILNLCTVFGLMKKDTNVTHAISTLSQSLAHLNSAVNPIIFWLFSSRKSQPAPNHSANADAHANHTHQMRQQNRHNPLDYK